MHKSTYQSAIAANKKRMYFLPGKIISISMLVLTLFSLLPENVFAQPGGYAFRMQANSNFGTAYLTTNNTPTTGISSTTVQAQSTASNYLIEWDNFANKWSNTNTAKNTEVTFTWGGGGFNGPDGTLSGGFINGKFYTLQIRGLAYANRQGVIMETDAAPQTFSSVAGPSAVCAGNSATVNVTLAGAKSAQERVFIRYAVNGNFAASKVVEATGTGSTWTTGSATIPGVDHTAGTTINYYAYTTTVAATNSSDHDLITLRFGNNGGSNYSYTVSGFPTAGITNNTGTTVLTCAQPSISLTATGGTTYTWNNGLGSGATKSITAPGTYVVTVANAAGCSANAQLIITQDIATPTAGITNNSGTTELTCTQTAISVTATGGASYAWDNGLGIGASKSITSPGTYTVTVSGTNGCTSTAQIVVTQNITTPSAGITNNSGTTVISCNVPISVTATGGVSYAWDNGLGTNATVSLANAGTYIVTATGANGCTATASITITVNNAANTFTGTGNWTDATKWSCGVVPSSGDAVVIGSGANATLNADVTVAGSLSMTATSSLTVEATRTLTVSGSADFNGQSVTFKSDNNGTASLGQVTGTITGATNVTVERYLPNNGFRSWRLLAVPTFGSQTIKQSWQEGNAALQNNTPGYGTQIAAVGNVPTVTAAGFDNASTQTSIQRYNGTNWVNLTSTLNPISNEKAYFLFVRGDRTQGVIGATTQTTATTLRTRGSIYTGSQASGTIAANSFQVLGNPFVSAIDFTGLNRTGGVKNTFYIWDSKKQSGTSLGAYQTFSSTNGFACLLGGGSYVLGSPNTAIQSGQAFFVETGASSGTITIPESAKVASNGTFGFRPTTPASAMVKIDTRLYSNNGNLADANVVVFDDAYSAAVDGDDALKLANPGENLAIARNNQSLAVEGRPTIAAEDVVDFKIWNLQQQQYKLEFAASNMAGLTAVLEDKFLNSRTRIDLATTSSVNFTVTADAASKAADRFRLVFAPAAPLPVSFLSVSANRTAAGVQANWKVAAERNISKYEVERSENGRTFTKAGTVTATGNNNDQVYGFNDATAPAGSLFYRVKSIGTAGDIKYSSIVKVAAGAVKAGYSIAPNPVEGGVVNLQFSNQPAGLYNVRVLNVVGQSLMTQQAVHAGGSSTQVLNLPANIARGTYQIEIIAPDNTRTTQSLFVNSK